MSIIVKNKKSGFEYHLEKSIEAGIELLGWEIKAIRDKGGKVNFNNSYVMFKDGEAFLFGCHIHPTAEAAKVTKPDPLRTRKLLLHKRQINSLMGSIAQKDYTCIPVNLHWKGHKVKVDIALAKGKKLHDKRVSLKEKAVKRDNEKSMKMRY